MTRSVLFPALALLALAACEVVPADPQPDPDASPAPGAGGDADSCGLARLQEFMGQPAEAVTAAMFAAPVRVIRPGEVVTMDFNAERINFVVNAQGRIEEAYCG